MANGEFLFIPTASPNSSYVLLAPRSGDPPNAVLLSSRVLMAGAHVNRPAASPDYEGCLYLETDTDGGTLFRCDGTGWVQTGVGVAGAAFPTGGAGGDLGGTYPNPTVQQAGGAFALAGVAMVQFGVAGPFAMSWPAANRAIFVPFVVLAPVLARALFIVDTAPGNGTFDLGVYDEAGERVVSTGPFATTANYHTVPLPDTLLTPRVGYYYMAACRSTTHGTDAYSLGSVIRVRVAGAAKVDLGSGVLPSQVTLESMVDDVIPNMGLCTQPLVM